MIKGIVIVIVVVVSAIISIYRHLGGGKQAPTSWQCPECKFFNEPFARVCACGYRATEADWGSD